MNRYQVTIRYFDRRTGAQDWRDRLDARHIRIAVNRALTRFFTEKPFTGSAPHTGLRIEAVKIGHATD